ncbi:TRAP transporter small permease [Coraliomargarita algicola]|uniref:TRAP transporter small permease n=1 Tax=Coraliomargarita algicola TaxID=3092156 RepID=A0ABZ0RL64_9BACT|nr:TRAP transporter small permease [Coraliomargarita sp. J2-16]WPJ96267.1 TRAP transporter small permease [Coraliomargarita sp. J2-16]
MLKRINQQASRLLNFLLIIIFIVLVVDVLWGVASRYLLGHQARWSEELARLLMVWLALLGAALASREGQHLGLDVVVRQWTADVQRWAGVVVQLFVLVFAVIIMAWGGGQLVAARFESGQLLPALDISRAWFYLALPVSGLLVSCFSLERLLDALRSAPEAQEDAS